ncbi:acid protease [Glonium stellatum]|uniref:Acid protease n=1 Tax=Glonium stellatum TaxID=574774 RepID=A0A8E2JW19_9PEZI|nr:acid protease [Glonium stellatum]
MALKGPTWFGIWFGTWFALLALAAAQCDISPLQLTWSNTTVSNDGLAVTRGIEVGIGTPNQIFAFRPATTLNNTRINNVLGCVSAANDSCVGGEGGVFDSSKSSTYEVSIKAQWNGSQIDQESSTGAYVYFNDVVDFQSNGHVRGFPLVMDSEPGSQSGLPLGTNSSFLRAAVMGGVAPSTAFGLWTGSRSVAPVDGLLVIGGYDQARVAGPFTSFPIGNWSLSRSCPLQVTVSQVTYAGISLFANSSETMNACIEPSTQRNVFTPDVATAFGRVTSQNSSAYSGMDYPINQRPTGDLTITLSNGYNTTITNFELFAPLRGSDQYGRYAIVNNSVIEAGVADNRKASPSSVLPTLGGLFLTFNYLIVDYEKSEFRLAPAVPSNEEVPSSNITAICTPTPTPTPSSSPTPSSPPSATSTSKSSSKNVGAIAGGTVGGVIGFALLCGLAFFSFRRYRRHRDSVNSANSLRSPVSQIPSELAAREEPKPIHEMPTSRQASVRRTEGRHAPGSPVVSP